MFEVGDVIQGQYLVTRRFIGGMGVVYIVDDEVTERTVVLKTLRDDLFKSESPSDTASLEDLRSRFEREARAWVNLGVHPNIVPAVAFQRGEPPYLQLEFIQGATLSMLISSEPSGLNQGEAVRYAWHIARGLHHAHQCQMPRGGRGVIHRDIKPHNVLIQRDRTARLTDFGLACVIGEDRLTSSKSVMGTLQYMPPEQYQGLLNTNEQSDLYSLGVVIFEMLTGRLPFPGKTIPELWYQVRECKPPRISELRPDIDQRLEELVQHCLEKEPAERPNSADELSTALREIYETVSNSADDERICAWCGFQSNREHLICPLCQKAPKPKSVSSVWECVCGAQVSRNFRYCITCGTEREDKSTCRRCGKENPSRFRYCCYCGVELPIGP